MSNLDNLLALPDEILYRVLAHNPTWHLVSKRLQRVLKRIKPPTHITVKDILQYPRHPGDDQFVLENARRQVALIKRTSQFYTITGLAFTRRYDSSRVRDSLPTLTFNDWNEIFESCPQLDYLDFSKSQKFEPHHFPGNLGYALEQNPQIKLTYLNLYDLKLTLSHMFLFFRYFKHTRSFSTLKTLELGKNNFFPESNDDDRWIFEDLIEKIKELPALESLSFDEAQFQTNWVTSMRALVKHMGSSNLKTLSLHDIRVRNQLSNEKIEQIWLPLLEALEEGQFPHLKELYIGCNRLGREEIMRPRFKALQARRALQGRPCHVSF